MHQMVHDIITKQRRLALRILYKFDNRIIGTFLMRHMVKVFIVVIVNKSNARSSDNIKNACKATA